MPDFVAVGFVRIVTSRSVFLEPSSPADAFGFLDDLAATPGHLRWTATPSTDALFRELMVSGRVSGRSTSDAWIAALARSYDATLITFDHGMRRFPGVDLHVPTA